MMEDKSIYVGSATYEPRLGDHVTTPALPSQAIPGVVVSASRSAAVLIAYPHLGVISAYSGVAVTLVRRGTEAEAAEALERVATKLRKRAEEQELSA